MRGKYFSVKRFVFSVIAPGVAVQLERNHVATVVVKLRFKPTTIVPLTFRKYPNIQPANSTVGGLVESID